MHYLVQGPEDCEGIGNLSGLPGRRVTYMLHTHIMQIPSSCGTILGVSKTWPSVFSLPRAAFAFGISNPQVAGHDVVHVPIAYQMHYPTSPNST